MGINFGPPEGFPADPFHGTRLVGRGRSAFPLDPERPSQSLVVTSHCALPEPERLEGPPSPHGNARLGQGRSFHDSGGRHV